jgi:hypothetical protein
MRTLLFVLVLCSIAGLLTAFISDSIIDSDAADLMQLYQDFQSLAPSSARLAAESTCQMVTQCCPQHQSSFMKYAMTGQGEKFGELCFGPQGSSDFMTKIMACKPLSNMASLASDRQFFKFMEASKEKSASDRPNMEFMLQVCSQDELLALACDWNGLDKVGNCQRKMLQGYAAQGDQIYTNKVQQIKNDARKFNFRIKNALSS